MKFCVVESDFEGHTKTAKGRQMKDFRIFSPPFFSNRSFARSTHKLKKDMKQKNAKIVIQNCHFVEIET